MMHIKHDQNKGRHTNSETKYIDKGSDLISPEDSESDR
jgi:hypothetical protein